MLFDVSQISQIPASDAKRNILRAVTVFEKKTGLDLKSRRWYVVAAMNDGLPPSWILGFIAVLAASVFLEVLAVEGVINLF